MMVRELFDFVVDPSISDDDVDNYLEKVCLSNYNQFSLLST